MTDAASTDIKFEGIAHALNSRLLRVPQNQRSYSWERRNVEQYFEDLKTAMAKVEPEYFLGSIVSTNGPDEREEVVDGQQRLVTTAVLLAAARDFCVSKGDTERAAQIEAEYLFRKELRTLETVPRLILNVSDNDYFVGRVLTRGGAANPTKASHERLSEACAVASTWVHSLAESSSNPFGRIADLVDYLCKNVRVVWLRAADTANAFIVFETLNDRGLDLATSDLLKNHLFLLADKQMHKAELSWGAMNAALETAVNKPDVTEFVRHMWSSKHGPTRERELYASIKKKIVNKTDSLAFANELQVGAAFYVAMLNPENHFWAPYGSARQHMSDMNLLGMVQIRPLLLAVLETFSTSQVEDALRSMVSWGVRLLIAGGLGGGTMEEHYARAACSVRSKTTNTPAKLRRMLVSVIPSDKEFRHAFRTAKVSKPALARYYLRALERAHASNKKKSTEFVPNPNQDEVNLEHVLPKNLGSGWDVDPETHRANVTRLGNLALLQREDNMAISSAGFEEKRKVLKGSKFALTKLVAKSQSWGPAEIESRQQKLADLAVLAWPLA